jgi:hypothetical protein
MQREDAFDADAKADLSNGDALACPAVLPGDDHAFKNLQSLFVSFLDADVNLYGVARLERGDIVPQLRCLNII